MAKLYPPQIEGTIPAFCQSSSANETYITVPFAMNKAVSWNDFTYFTLKIKSIQTNNQIYYTNVSISENSPNINKEKMEIYFPITDSNLATNFKVGTSYKLQIAYREDGIDGYFSTVGIIKYTSNPDVYIADQTNGALQSVNNTYVGVYSQKNRDVTEKLYSYRFDVRNSNGDLIETSGELIHNHENDDYNYESNDQYSIIKTLEENKIYTIQYTITTVNGFVKSSPRYRIIQQTTVDPEIKAELQVNMNNENGYVNINLIGEKNNDGIEYSATGTFLICRSSSEDRYGSWSEVCRFALYGEQPSNYSWKDFTVQHGFDYIYSLQQYNQTYKVYSNRILSNTITANFEHCFLYDGKRQLKIKYNPKVSSFKTTLLESKTNTIGAQFPFFFRNGNVNYKEFPISGLISYLSDEEELFLTNEDLLLDDYDNLKREHTLQSGIKSADNEYFYNMLDANQAYILQDEYRKRELADSNENKINGQKIRTTNLTDYNITAERIFKLKVLEFLDNGKPKLFRSPTEGNYIVRLSNSSLTPNDQLNRMIHTFSTTATEIDNYNYSKLGEYNLLDISEPVVKQLRWKTILISDVINAAVANGDTDPWLSIGSPNNIQSIQCLGMLPGDRIQIRYNDVSGSGISDIQIGITGAYYTSFDVSPMSISIMNTCRQGQITIGYYGTSLNHFDTYRKINMSDLPIKQFIGEHTNDILEDMQDIKYRVTKYNFTNFVKRPLKTVNGFDEMISDLFIYILDGKYYDGTSKNIINNYQCKFYIDDKEIDLTETINFQLDNFLTIPKITLGNGVALDISVQRREIEYDVEQIKDKVIKAHNSYISALEKVQKLIAPTDEEQENEKFEVNYDSDLKKAKADCQIEYEVYLQILTKALQEKEVLDV